MYEWQKKANLYCNEEHIKQNYLLAVAWAEKMGLYAKELKSKILEMKEKYKDDVAVTNYLSIREEFADLYLNKIFPLVYQDLSEKIFNMVTINHPANFSKVSFLINEDGDARLDRQTEKESSNYIVGTKNKKGIFNF